MNEQKLLIRLSLLNENDKRELYKVLTEKPIWSERRISTLTKLINLGFVQEEQSKESISVRELDAQGNTRERIYYEYRYLPTELTEEILK